MEGMPIYVTRENLNHETGTYYCNPYVFIACIFMVIVNTLAWGLIGLIEAVRYFS